jgi:hypothetical protein
LPAINPLVGLNAQPPGHCVIDQPVSDPPPSSFVKVGFVTTLGTSVWVTFFVVVVVVIVVTSVVVVEPSSLVTVVLVGEPLDVLVVDVPSIIVLEFTPPALE